VDWILQQPGHYRPEHAYLDNFNKLFFSMLSSHWLILFPAVSKLLNKSQIPFVRVSFGERIKLVQK
jgi:hypothetical protein